MVKSNTNPEQPMVITITTLSLLANLSPVRRDRFTVPASQASTVTRDRLVRGVAHGAPAHSLFDVQVGNGPIERGYVVNGRFSAIPRVEA